MSYKYSKGAQVIGDLKAADDTQRDTKIDFEEDYIGFETSGSARMVVSGSKVGIGTTSPSTTLHAYANVSNEYVATIDNDQASSGHVLKLQTDGNGSGSRLLEMEDGDGDIIFRARADGRFGFGPDGVSSMGAGTFVVGIDNSSHTSDIAISQRLQHLGDSNTYLDFPSNDNITLAAGGSEELKIASDAILVKQYVKHDGDEDTLINFSDDKIILKAGNKAMITMEEKGSAPHEVTINDGGNNIDFVVKGNGSNQGNPGMKFDASTNKLGINGIGTPAYELEVAGDIGLAEYIYHRGDDDTYIRFEDDEISLAAGGRTFVNLQEGASDLLVINNGGLDIDFKVSGENKPNLIRTDAANDRVGIGTSSPDCELHVDGAIKNTGAVYRKTREVTSFPYTVANDDYVISVAGTGTPRRINLPAKDNHVGRVLIIKDATGNASSNNIEINPDGSENIDGASDKLINTNKAAVTIVCAGDQWLVIGDYSG